MLRALHILVVLIITFFSGFKPSVGSENSKNLPEVYVYVDTVSDITSIKAQEFIIALKARLAQSNINLEFTPIQNPFLPAARNTVASISFDPLFNHERIIQDYVVNVSAAPPKLKEISPILSNEVGITLSLTSSVAVDTVYAMLLLGINQCDLATPIFTDLKLDNSDINNAIDYNVATCYLLEGNYQKSIPVYQNLLYMDTPRFLGINLAWLYLKTGQESKAFELMSSAIEMAKQSNEAPETLLAVRAQLYNLAFRYNDAITDLTAAIQLTPTDPTLYTLRGQTYLLLYQWDNVADDYNKAIKLDPTYADAYFYRGVLYYSILQTGQAMYTDALADFQHYLTLAPNGEHAAEATRYATDIQTQISALNN